MRKIKSIINKKNGMTSKEIFEEAGVTKVNEEKRCKALRILAKEMKTIKHLPALCKYHKEKCEGWLNKYMKSNFVTVSFSNKCRTILERTDGWA